MIATQPNRHLLALEMVGRVRESEEDLTRSLEILRELVIAMPTYLAAHEQGAVVLDRLPGGLCVLFEEISGPIPLALELADLFQDLPSMEVRMAIHEGTMDAVLDLLSRAAVGEIVLSESFAHAIQSTPDWSDHIQEEADTGRFVVRPQRLVLVGAAAPGRPALESALTQDGHEVADERAPTKLLAWARSLEAQIRAADTVVAFVSGESADDEVLQLQLEIAADERRKRGFPQILPVWLAANPAAERSLGVLNRNLRQAHGMGPNVVDEIRSALAAGQVEIDPDSLETSGGAVATDSRFYIRRTADAALETALRRQESIVLLKGPRQIGKTSLIGHGVGVTRDLGWRTVHTDFQRLSSRQLQTEEAFCRAVATTFAQQIGVNFDFDAEWFEPLGGNLNLDRFVRAFLDAAPGPLVWFIDEADRIFTSPFASDFFGLVRSWHNSRATERGGPWPRLTVVIGYATEAHLFIRDLNQSPFNVGRPVDIPMFTIDNMADLNGRYGSPIPNDRNLAQLFSLIDGQPFLSRRAFDVLATREMSFAELMEEADAEDGPFGAHLKRMLASVTQLPEVWDALVRSLSDPDVPESDGLYRLIAAGILMRRPGKRLDLACELYRRFLAHYLDK